jgi:hypothetical protein
VKDAQKRDYISQHTLVGRLREDRDAGELVLSLWTTAMNSIANSATIGETAAECRWRCRCPMNRWRCQSRTNRKRCRWVADTGTYLRPRLVLQALKRRQVVAAGGCREIMDAPKVLARYLDVEVNGLNEVFLLPDWRVASCCEPSVRNITKQNHRFSNHGQDPACLRHRRTFSSLTTTARPGR